MKKVLSVIFLFLLVSSPVLAGDYNYVPPETVKHWIEAKASVMILDIQVEPEFNAHHLPGSIATYAYPVKSDVERAKLDMALSTALETGSKVVVVCPRGKGGAKRAYEYLKSGHVPEEKLLILEGGMGGWPYKEMIESH